MNYTTITIDMNKAYAVRKAARRSMRNVRGKLYKTRNQIRAQINHHKNMLRIGGKKRSPTMILSIVEQYPEKDINILSSNYSNDRINAADGHFFETYSAIQCKQENRNRLDSHETPDDEHYEAVQVLAPDRDDVDTNRLLRWTKRENDFLYKVSLSTIENRLGMALEDEVVSSNVLYDYVKEVFSVADDDHDVLLLESSSEQENLIPILNVTVIAANGLEAKDPNGFSDPYCLLGIMPPKETDAANAMDHHYEVLESEVDGIKKESKDVVKKKKKWYKLKKKKNKKRKKVKLRDKVPEQAIKQTNVVKENLNPKWQESFTIDLQDLQDDIFHLEIWDHDEDSTVLGAMKHINEVSGVKGMGRYFKQIVNNAKNTDGNVDDFLGMVNIPIKDISSHGKMDWFKLEGKSEKSKAKGKIKLQLNLGYRKEKDEDEEEVEEEVRMNPVECYRCILTRLVEHELQQMENSSRWDGTLNHEAVYLLHQLAIQNQLTQLNFAYSRWLAYSKAHTVYAMDYRFLHSLLKMVEEQWKMSQQINSTECLTSKEEVELADSFDAFVKYCICLLRKQRDVFPPHKKNVTRLEWLLKCLQHLQALDIYKKLCPSQTEIRSQIINGIKEGTVEWFHRIHAFSEPGTTTDGDMVSAIASMTNTLNLDLIRSYKYTGKLYQAMLQIDYFSIAYKSFDELLGDDVVDLMKDVNQRLKSKTTDSTDISTSLFELYLALKDFLAYKQYLNKSDAEALVLADYHKYFKKAVQNWLALAYNKAVQRIEKAVELDKVKQVDAMVKHSTSAVDVACCFGQIREFYSKLDWPDVEGSYVFVMKITDDICRAAMFYADIIHKKLISKGYYDEEGQFDVTDQLCIAINNIEQVRRSLAVLPKSLNWDKLWVSVAMKQGEQSSEQCKSSLEGMLASADDDMVNIILRVAGRVGDKMRPDVKKYIFQLAYAPAKHTLDDAITPLMQYLDKNLITLSEGLLKLNFDRILETLWQVVLDEMREQVIGEHEQHNTSSNHNGQSLGSHTIQVLKSTIGDYTKKKIGALPNIKRKSKSLKARKTSTSKEENQKGPEFFNRLHSSLEILLEFFNADGKGLTMEDLMIEDCKTLLSCLVNNKSSTDELITSYYSQHAQEQLSMIKSLHGTLEVICYYNPIDCKLFVEVCKATNLKALDCNGVSDPFVMIELCPRHMFSLDPQRTKVIKKTLNPVFKQSFEFDVKAEQCKQRGACVVFNVMDHDMMFSNDLEGEAMISLETIPGINLGTCSQQHTLSLMKPVLTDEAQAMFTILSNRHGDKNASDFVKKRYHSIDQAKCML